MSEVVAAAMAAASAALAIPADSPRLPPHPSRGDAETRARRLRLLVAIGVGAAISLLVSGALGWVIGCGAGLFVHRWMSSLPSESALAAKRRRRDELPVVVDLLAACLSSGAPPLDSLRLVATTATSSIGAQLNTVAAAHAVGASPDEAWRLIAEADFAPVVETMCRTAQAGAPAAEQLRTVASDLRGKAREAALNDARKLGVRTAGPLGLCFLPAFVLIGVVPLVLSLVQMWTWG